MAPGSSRSLNLKPSKGGIMPDSEFAAYRARVERALERHLHALAAPPALLEAMRYATLGGGKRLRACLVYATGEALGSACADLDDAACAVELIHAYSLVHDDLPCMDNDDMRRGKPSCHRAFGEALALLAGDALQTAAFEVLATTESPQRVRMLRLLAKATGAAGMAGGQALDLGQIGLGTSIDALEDMHRRKTGALIQASVLLGGLAAGAPPGALEPLAQYGSCVGLAFQIMDDVLDADADVAPGAAARPNYPALLGLEAAKARAAHLRDRALVSLAFLGDNRGALSTLADFIIDRNH